MIENKFLCYQTEAEFLKEKSLIADTSIVFVLDPGFIYTHGVTFIDPQATAIITQALGYLEERVIENERTLGMALSESLGKLGGIEDGAQKNTVLSVAGKVGAVILAKSDVGLGNVDNTADLNKPISTATQTALNGKVDKVSGKTLTTNDYTTTEKNKLKGIEEGAQKNAVLSVAGKTGNVVLEGEDLGDDVSTAAIGSLKSRIDTLEGTMGTVISELRLEIQKLKDDKEL